VSSFGVDANYKIKKLESRIRAAEEERDRWLAKYNTLYEMHVAETEEYKRIILKFHENGIQLPKGKPATKRPPGPRGRKRMSE